MLLVKHKTVLYEKFIIANIKANLRWSLFWVYENKFLNRSTFFLLKKRLKSTPNLATPYFKVNISLKELNRPMKAFLTQSESCLQCCVLSRTTLLRKYGTRYFSLCYSVLLVDYPLLLVVVGMSATLLWVMALTLSLTKVDRFSEEVLASSYKQGLSSPLPIGLDIFSSLPPFS